MSESNTMPITSSANVSANTSATTITITDSDLNNCDREPIHIPGAILPHGVLLVLDSDTLEVLQAAGDLPGLLGKSLHDLLGKSADTVLNPAQTARVRRLSAEQALTTPRHLLDPAMRVHADMPLDASLHRCGDTLVLEFEAANIGDPFASDPLAAVQDMVMGFDAAPSLPALCQQAAERVREVAVYDRVLVYQFMQDGSGWVIAESREPHLDPFLDLHYPAADIPQQARAVPEELVAAHHRGQLRPCAADAVAQSSHRPAARHESRHPARCVTNPPRVSAQYGHRRVDVHLHHSR